ncbi:MAG: replication-associated recombination protein A [Firmicutes bacterium]|nr:replication-associated recombination protein A [Bacillota bacterium]MCL2256375.1 replication-associated recombination protein A [Bacillota bacterium]
MKKMQNDFFDNLSHAKIALPLAARMRPDSFSEFIGQGHILANNSLLMRAIRAKNLGSCIFFGPPGTGKTTLASLIAKGDDGSAYVVLNAVASGVADAKREIEEAKERLKMFGKRTYLVLDECHRWNKAQQDCILPAVEDGTIIFIGSTTEHPYIAMTKPILSRCKIFEFKKLNAEEIEIGLKRALTDKSRGMGNYEIDLENGALKQLANYANGDFRHALNVLELSVLSSVPDENGTIHLNEQVFKECLPNVLVSVDEGIHYDVLSAFCKSLRGSDVDASLYYAFRLVEAGSDPLTIFRRLIAHACEDVGMADSNALMFVISAMTAYEKIGMPEGALPLSHAIIYVASAPKSNAVVLARAKAQEIVKTRPDDNIPHYLRDRNYPSTLDDKSQYVYPHTHGGYYSNQKYLPKSLENEKIYEPTENGDEKRVKDFLREIKSL